MKILKSKLGLILTAVYILFVVVTANLVIASLPWFYLWVRLIVKLESETVAWIMYGVSIVFNIILLYSIGSIIQKLFNKLRNIDN